MNSINSVFVKSPAKLNLFLHVISKLETGYHSIESIFVPISWYDEIYIEKTHNNMITREGDIVGEKHDDLLFKAANLLKAYISKELKKHISITNKSGCKLVVKKTIPAGAGLGGGSSNAAITLKILNKMWGLNLSQKQLLEIGKELGADVPFFLQNHSCFVSGIGESLIQLFEESFLPNYFVVVVPEVNVSTHEVFRSFSKNYHSSNTKFLSRNSIEIESMFQNNNSGIWTYGKNDIEQTTSSKYPIVKQTLNLLKKIAKNNRIPESSCRMSGTGGAIFCSTPTLAIAKRITSQLQANKTEKILIKICERLPFKNV